MGSVAGFEHFDPDREEVLQLIKMSDHDDLLEIFLYRRDGVHDALAASRVLGTKTLVDEKRGQRQPMRCANTFDRAMRSARLMRKASPPLNRS